MSVENQAIVIAFCESLVNGDMAKAVTYLSEDIRFHPIMPSRPVIGPARIRKFLDPFVHGEKCALVRMDIKHTTSSGNIVMNEREETWVTGAARVQLPVMGVFALRSDKITEWRDYCDSATLAPVLEVVRAGRPPRSSV